MNIAVMMNIVMNIAVIQLLLLFLPFCFHETSNYESVKTEII